jgi:glucosamine-6-phosphate deaminase
MEIKHFQIDNLAVEIHSDRISLGIAAGKAAAERIKELLNKQKTVRMIFAAAPSQNEFLDSLCAAQGIDWSKVEAFHMDDYPGLSNDAPQRFSSYLKEHLFNRVPFGQVHYLIGPHSPLVNKDVAGNIVNQACADYAKLLAAQPIDIVCMGIGENGHIAFNDPSVADFNDPELVKLVKLDETCRMQQVHDGCFPTLAAVPTHALTLTIPALMSAHWVYCMVPGKTKQQGVKNTLELSEPTTKCPATILRQHQQARLYLDQDAAMQLDRKLIARR